MEVELIFEDVGEEIYGLVDHDDFSSEEPKVIFEGSKQDVLSFYIGMVGPLANA